MRALEESESDPFINFHTRRDAPWVTIKWTSIRAVMEEVIENKSMRL